MIARVRPVLPSAVIGLFIAAAMLWVVPAKSRNPLVETAVWALLVLVSFVGWGAVVRFAVIRTSQRPQVDIGLRAAWGAGLLCFLGGTLMVFAAMTRLTALVLVEVGVVLALVSLALERRAVSTSCRLALRLSRMNLGLAFVALAVGGLVVVQCLSAISDWHTNPYDDDIAYLAFLRKLSDTGTVLEPFSFRRLSAYGGQTFFLLLTSIRATPSQAHTFDRAVAFLMIVLLIMGHRTRGRRPSYLFVISTIAMLATLPSIAINTASYWSGAVFFLALFRTLVWLDDKTDIRPLGAALPLALVSIAACTLRQNYLPIPVLVLATSYLVRARRWSTVSIGARFAEPALVALLAIVFILPWFVVSWQSSRTFLYPIMPGTFHQALALNASGWNFVREVAFQLNVAIDGLPLASLGLFALALPFVREPGTRRPLGAMCVGAFGGFVALVHGLTQSDAQNIGRYCFSFVVALTLALALTTGTARLAEKLGRLHVAAGIVAFAILAQLVISHEKLSKDYALKFHNIELLAYANSRVRETEPPELRLYRERLQGAIPAGERLAVLVDEPYHLDFARNPIWNLDMPGYASLPPGMPSFKGSEALESYFRGLGLRWVMFVLPEYSRYHYRREYFLELFVHEQEIWRTYAPYLVDFIDSMTAIRKRHREAYSERGIVVIDLDASATARAPDGKEPR